MDCCFTLSIRQLPMYAQNNNKCNTSKEVTVSGMAKSSFPLIIREFTMRIFWQYLQETCQCCKRFEDSTL